MPLKYRQNPIQIPVKSSYLVKSVDFSFNQMPNLNKF